MKVQQVISRALTDESFARELSAKALAAAHVAPSRENVRGAEWTDILSEFAESPEELARLTSNFDQNDAGDGNTWTTTSVTSTTATITTFPCLTTTTTCVTTTITAGM